MISEARLEELRQWANDSGRGCWTKEYMNELLREIEQLRKGPKDVQLLWVVLERVGGKGKPWKPVRWGVDEREVREWREAERAQRRREKNWESRNPGWGGSKQPRRELKLARATLQDLR